MQSYAGLITDLRLPGMDGLELIRRARAIDEDMAVLLITAYASVESAVEALRLGADDYLLKPLIAEEVLRRGGEVIILEPGRLPVDDSAAAELF